MVFKIDGAPKGKGRPRFTRSGHVFTPSDTKQYESRVAELYRDNGGIFLGEDVPVAIRILACYPVPKSASKKEKEAKLKGEIACLNKPDVDNVCKIILDGLNGTAFQDDKQVVTLEVYKKWAKSGEGAVYVSVHKAPSELGDIWL